MFCTSLRLRWYLEVKTPVASVWPLTQIHNAHCFAPAWGWGLPLFTPSLTAPGIPVVSTLFLANTAPPEVAWSLLKKNCLSNMWCLPIRLCLLMLHGRGFIIWALWFKCLKSADFALTWLVNFGGIWPKRPDLSSWSNHLLLHFHKDSLF